MKWIKKIRQCFNLKLMRRYRSFKFYRDYEKPHFDYMKQMREKFKAKMKQQEDATPICDGCGLKKAKRIYSINDPFNCNYCSNECREIVHDYYNTII